MTVILATTMTTLVTLVGTVGTTSTSTAPFQPLLPSPHQSIIQDNELSMFIHFSMCTFAGCEHDNGVCRTNPATLFDPQPAAALNPEEWVLAAVDLGAKQACLTAHHDGGFALWPTAFTNYSIKYSKWVDGKGNIVKRFAAACRKHNISTCFYVSELLDCWEANDTAATYLTRVVGMLTELLTMNGPVERLWFDFYG
jgi:alpha-L-fucosidase